MKSLNILRLLAQDAAANCSADTERDWICIQKRFKHEGESFLTITLPTFSTWLEKSIEEKQVDPAILSSFRQWKKGSPLPAFLRGLTSRVFDPVTGRILVEPDPTAVFFIRQICNNFKKVKDNCTEKRNSDTIKKFVETDTGLPKRIVFSKVVQSVAFLLVSGLSYSASDLRAASLPKHGPGAVVERLQGNQKYKNRDYYARWTGRIEIEDLYGVQPMQDQYTSVVIVPEFEEKPCRLRIVPKTMKAPRLIAKEPVAMQFAQQLVSSRLINAMSKSPYHKHIRFDDQSINKHYACEGSLNRGYATIDLSEASDRVSNSLVRELVKSDPVLRSELFSVRSSKIQMLDGSILVLNKFSTSGSAITFPVETFVFHAIAVSAIVEDGIRRRLWVGDSMRSIVRRVSTEVSVFGDDIIVPDTVCAVVMDALEAYGLKVNRKKTFYKGLFRESCGGDYFDGYDVTPKYLRLWLPHDKTDLKSLFSAVTYSNQLFLAGCWKTAEWIRSEIGKIASIPFVKATSPGIGWYTYQQCYDFSSKRNSYGEYVVRTLVSRTKSLSNEIDGYDALLKHLISVGPSEDETNLTHSTPSFRSKVGYRMVTPY